MSGKIPIQLNVNASGASEVLYRGTPLVEADVAGASSVRKLKIEYDYFSSLSFTNCNVEESSTRFCRILE